MKKKEESKTKNNKKLFIIIGAILFGVLIIIIVAFLSNNDSNKELLYGEWSYDDDDETAWNYHDYTFNKDGTMSYYECYDLTISLNSDNDACAGGSTVWRGKYTISKNIITIKDLEIDKNDSYNPSLKLRGPVKQLIIDWDNMYMCNRNDGLDCNKKYEKNTEDDS